MVTCLVSVDINHKYRLIKFLDTSNEDGDEQSCVKDTIHEYEGEKPGVYIVEISLEVRLCGNHMDGQDWDFDLSFGEEKEINISL